MDRTSRALLLSLMGLVGCFSPEDGDPPPGAETDAGTTGDSPVTTTGFPMTSSTGDEPPASTTEDGSSSGEDETSTGAPGSSTSGTGGSSTGAEPACGDGTAQAGEFCIDALSTLELTATPQRLLVGDLDGNARLDLVYAAVDAGTLGVLLGDGQGGFGQGPAQPLSPQVATLGHFNDDDALDIAYLDTAILLHVVLGDGNGTLPSSSTGASGIGNVALATGDLDNDGYDDVLSVGAGGAIGLAVSDDAGTGTFTATTIEGLGNGLRNGVVVADLDGNDDLDFAFTDVLGEGQVVACRGNGAGGTSSCSPHPVGSLPVGLAAGDIDADGSTDLVAANSVSNTVTVLRGQGNGTFEDGVEVPTGASPQQVALADLDLDGFDDLIVSHTGDAVVHLRLYDPDAGVFGRPWVFDIPAGTPTDIAVGDFNDDGALDVAVGNATEAALSLLLSDA